MSANSTPPTNHHCTCILINATGIMIEGPSGSGKTTLALGLLEAARNRGAKCHFICDDQAMLQAIDNVLIATVPETIAGKVEVYGFGIADIEFKANCKIDLVCSLIDDAQISRVPQKSQCQRLGLILDHVQVPMRHEAQAIRILLQHLALPL